MSRDEVEAAMLGFESGVQAGRRAQEAVNALGFGPPPDPTMRLTMRHVRWAAEECYWQQSGEPSVAWMLDGWSFATEYATRHPVDLDLVLMLGRLVEPRHNLSGLRTVDVRVGSSVKMPYQHVPEAMSGWVNFILGVDPTEAFRQYEEIHPFRDGNGRTGSIIFNLLNGTLDAPVHPPNLWNDPSRYEGDIRD